MAVGTTAAEGRLLGMYGKKSRGSKILAKSWRGDFVKFYLALPKMRVAPQMPPPPKFRDLAPPLMKGKWQQKFNSSHLKEIKKQCIEVYCKIFISFFFWQIYSHLNQRTVRHL